MKIYRPLLILARAIDHRVGQDDYDAPDVPILTQYEAWTAKFKFWIG